MFVSIWEIIDIIIMTAASGYIFMGVFPGTLGKHKRWQKFQTWRAFHNDINSFRGLSLGKNCSGGVFLCLYSPTVNLPAFLRIKALTISFMLVIKDNLNCLVSVCFTVIVSVSYCQPLTFLMFGMVIAANRQTFLVVKKIRSPDLRHY